MFLGDDDTGYLHMIHPFFIEEPGVYTSQNIPITGTKIAEMYVILEERKPFYREKIYEGMKFTYNEGSKVVAHGEVIELTGLLNT